MKVKFFLVPLFLCFAVFTYSSGEINIKNTTDGKIVVLLEIGEEGISYKTYTLEKNKEIKNISNKDLKAILIYKAPLSLKDKDGKTISITNATGETQTIRNLPNPGTGIEENLQINVTYLITESDGNYFFGASAFS